VTAENLLGIGTVASSLIGIAARECGLRRLASAAGYVTLWQFGVLTLLLLFD